MRIRPGPSPHCPSPGPGLQRQGLGAVAGGDGGHRHTRALGDAQGTPRAHMLLLKCKLPVRMVRRPDLPVPHWPAGSPWPPTRARRASTHRRWGGFSL